MLGVCFLMLTKRFQGVKFPSEPGHVCALSGDSSWCVTFLQALTPWLFIPEVASFVDSRLLCSLPADLIISLSPPLGSM